MKPHILKPAALNALGTALYVTLVVSFIFYIPQILGPVQEPQILIPISMLLLFVFSAALTSFLVLGKPILWYLDGQKKEAISLFAYTLGMLFILMLIAFCALATFGK